MRRAIMGLAAIGLPGCATTGGDDGPDSAPMPMQCNAEQVQSYVGKQASADSGEAILRDSGARTLRWGPPNAAWTMDYRQDRVNVQYDAGMIIKQITCG